MDFNDTPTEAAFRQEVREFIRTQLPEELKPANQERREAGAMFGGGGPAMKAWTKALVTSDREFTTLNICNSINVVNVIVCA